MPTNLLSPFGLVLSRPRTGGSPTEQANQYKIKNGYASNIGIGDLVKTGTGANQGYVVLATPNDTNILGVFAGVLPYYDTTLQAITNGKQPMGSYSSAAAPPAGVDIDCLVIDDYTQLFRAQLQGGPWQQAYRGQNVNFLSNGAPGANGLSTLVLDGTSIAVTNTLPLKIVGLTGVTGGPQDPANTNPWLEVQLNTAEALSSGGI